MHFYRGCDGERNTLKSLDGRLVCMILLSTSASSNPFSLSTADAEMSTQRASCRRRCPQQGSGPMLNFIRAHPLPILSLRYETVSLSSVFFLTIQWPSLWLARVASGKTSRGLGKALST
jgi:hypothetical protein